MSAGLCATYAVRVVAPGPDEGESLDIDQAAVQSNPVRDNSHSLSPSRHPHHPYEAALPLATPFICTAQQQHKHSKLQ